MQVPGSPFESYKSKQILFFASLIVPSVSGLGSQNNNADQLSSQFVTSLQVIPAKIVSFDCICAIRLLIKR